jgi:hypothetical protein
MENIGRLAAPDRFEAVLERASDETLDTARDEVTRFCGGISDMAYVLRQTIDNWAYGFAAWGQYFDALLDQPPSQAQLVLMWLSCQDAGLGPGMQTVLESLVGQPALREQFETLAALRSAVPAVGAAIPLSWFGHAMRNQEYQQRIQRAFAALRETHSEQIDGFLASRPTVALGVGPLERSPGVLWSTGSDSDYVRPNFSTSVAKCMTAFWSPVIIGKITLVMTWNSVKPSVFPEIKANLAASAFITGSFIRRWTSLGRLIVEVWPDTTRPAVAGAPEAWTRLRRELGRARGGGADTRLPVSGMNSPGDKTTLNVMWAHRVSGLLTPVRGVARRPTPKPVDPSVPAALRLFDQKGASTGKHPRS